MTTHIEWTDETWNPVVGCSIASPGCDNCYAAKEAAGRLSGLPQYKGLAVRVDGVPQFTGEIRLLPERLAQPRRWRKPRRIFVNSMSDLFHPAVPEGFIGHVFYVMGSAEQHTFQVLTKRPQRMAALLGQDEFPAHLVHDHGLPRAYSGWPFTNVWLGTSIENQRYADLRIHQLLATPAAVRFLSIEPLLGPIDLTPWLDCPHTSFTGMDAGGYRWRCDGCGREHLAEPDPNGPVHGSTQRWRHDIVRPHGIDWVIVGGESGPHARPMHPQWVRTIRDQCVAAGIPFFFKQWGEWGIPGWRVGVRDGEPVRMGKRNAGRELDGRTWDEYPT